MTGGPVIIAGVGRSGTTALFELIDGWRKAMGQTSPSVYEPYVWASAALFKDGALNPDGFTTQAYSARGILTHLETPLFLRQADMAHDAFAAGLLPDGEGLIKMIRGCGRLEAYLRAYPEAKIIGVGRNPFDTLNSSHLHFSLLGDEFHRSDKTRLKAGIQDAFGDTVETPDSPDDKEHVWAGLWWLYMNRALMEAYAAAPDRIMLLPYELLLENEAVARDRIAGFLGWPADKAPTVTQDRKRVGVTSKARKTLIEEERDHLRDYQTWYEDHWLDPLETKGLVSERYRLEGLLEHYSETTAHSLLRRYPTWRTSLGWRFIYDGRVGHKDSSAQARLETAERLIAASQRSAARPRAVDGLGVSVIISVFNETPEALEIALGSVLSQTLRPAEIILADDASDQAIAAHCADLANAHDIVRHERREANVGPGLNRHIATLSATSNWVSHLDADDSWRADKLEREWAALQDTASPDTAVAMSDVDVFENGGYDHSWSMAALAEAPFYHRVGYMMRRAGPIPRDMLMSKSLYEQSGGFETYARAYEDWAFKLRLVRIASAWAATGETGLRYNREANHGLSAGGAVRHVYWRIFALLRNADLEPDFQPFLRQGLWAVSGLLPAHEWVRKLLRNALQSLGEEDDAYRAIRDAAPDFIARAQNAFSDGDCVEAIEAFARTLTASAPKRPNNRLSPRPGYSRVKIVKARR